MRRRRPRRLNASAPPSSQKLGRRVDFTPSGRSSAESSAQGVADRPDVESPDRSGRTRRTKKRLKSDLVHPERLDERQTLRVQSQHRLEPFDRQRFTRSAGGSHRRRQRNRRIPSSLTAERSARQGLVGGNFGREAGDSPRRRLQMLGSRPQADASPMQIVAARSLRGFGRPKRRYCQNRQNRQAAPAACPARRRSRCDSSDAESASGRRREGSETVHGSAVLERRTSETCRRTDLAEGA